MTSLLLKPMSYIELDQEEMMYLDGGDWITFRDNIRCLTNASQSFRGAAREVGFWGHEK